MLLRAQYGGMSGDMKMLHAYVGLWAGRAREAAIPTKVVERISQRNATPSVQNSAAMRWWDVPTVIHARARVQSRTHVTQLAGQGIEKLSLQDICLAGVDFHCSSVLDHAIADDFVFEACCEKLSTISASEGLSPLPTNKGQRREYLVDTLKTCMWNFSSGVNHRRPLLTEAQVDEGEKEAALKSFWDETVAPRVEEYMRTYVADRLAR